MKPRIVPVVVAGLSAGIVLTAIGAADADGLLGLLLTPGRLFNHAFGFDSGPPEVGVVYGLGANSVMLAAVTIALSVPVIRRVRRQRSRKAAVCGPDARRT